MHLEQKSVRKRVETSVFDVVPQILTKKTSEDRKSPTTFSLCHFSKNFNKRPRNLSNWTPRRKSPGTFVWNPLKVACYFFEICDKKRRFYVKTRRFYVKTRLFYVKKRRGFALMDELRPCCQPRCQYSTFSTRRRPGLRGPRTSAEPRSGGSGN